MPFAIGETPARRRSVLLDELWVRQVAKYRHFLRILKHFDLVILYYSQNVATLSEQIAGKCVFLPPSGMPFYLT